ncbi:hypothetical protein [Oscillibacter sp.]|uniref:hypothetical protein n=1 Tax=Oscillibacter sp. TaxID=1945593 RepID=UPI00289BA8EC|nr:hypothetical protein [Oscillibacter sp.]
MNIDWSATAAWIALVVAIISPIVTSIINNRHLSKIKKMEIIQQRGLAVIEEYISVTSREILITGVSDAYEKIYAKVFIYVPKSLHSQLEELNSLICDCGNTSFPDKEKCQKLLVKISQSLKYDTVF